MRIVQCPKCRKYLHETKQCFYCGNTGGFIDLNEIQKSVVHANVADDYAKLNYLLTNKKFDEVLTLSDIIIEWMPDSADIFWTRLLARNMCVSTAELIKKGFDCENDSDFYNVIKFASGIEKNVYLDIQSLVLVARETLKKDIINHEYSCKIETNILQIQKKLPDEISLRKKKLFSLWSDLENTERTLYILELDCQFVSREYSEAIDKAVSVISNKKNKAFQLEECSANVFYKYQIEVGSILLESEDSLATLDNLKKQHPLVHTVNELIKKRDEQVRILNNEISSLKSYEATIQQTLNRIDTIVEQHKEAIRAVEEFDFSYAFNLLGKDYYENFFQNIARQTDIWTTKSIRNLQFYKENNGG